MALVEITNGDKFIQALEGVKKTVSSEVCLAAVQAGAGIVEAAGKLNIDKQGLRDQGKLIGSYQVYDPKVSRDGAECKVGSRGVIYNAVHEFGATISAKRTKYLAIPTEGNKSPTPKEMGGLHFVPGRGGGVLMDKAGEVKFVLKPSVKIPARPYHRPAVDESRREVLDVMAATIRRSLS